MLPTAITIIQMVHRQPRVLLMNPPTIGATQGPINGRAMATAIAVPRSSWTNRSPIMLGARVSEVTAIPFIKRKATSMEIFWLSAAATEQRIKRRLPPW